METGAPQFPGWQLRVKAAGGSHRRPSLRSCVGRRLSGPASGYHEPGAPRGASSLSGAPGTSAPAPRACELRGSAPGPPRASCPTHPLPEARRSGGRRRPAPRPSSARAATRSRKCAARRSGEAALGAGGAREVRALWRPPGLAAGRKGSRVPTHSLVSGTRWLRCVLLELLTPKWKPFLFCLWFDFHAPFSRQVCFSWCVRIVFSL